MPPSFAGLRLVRRLHTRRDMKRLGFGVLGCLLVLACGGDGTDSGVPANKTVGELTSQEAQAICDASAKRVAPSVACALAGMTAGAIAVLTKGDPVAVCGEAMQRCDSQQRPAGRCALVTTRTKARSCDVTAGELEQCARAAADVINAAFERFSCDSLTTQPRGPRVEEPAICKDLERRCPALDDDDRDTSAGSASGAAGAGGAGGGAGSGSGGAGGTGGSPWAGTDEPGGRCGPSTVVIEGTVDDQPVAISLSAYGVGFGGGSAQSEANVEFGASHDGALRLTSSPYAGQGRPSPVVGTITFPSGGPLGGQVFCAGAGSTFTLGTHTGAFALELQTRAPDGSCGRDRRGRLAGCFGSF